MIRIHFKDLDSSELAREIVMDRLQEVLSKFPSLRNASMAVTLSMENSPRHPGPDLFGVKVRISRLKIGQLILEKKSDSLYKAVADLQEALFEKLHRSLDRVRTRRRNQYSKQFELGDV